MPRHLSRRVPTLGKSFLAERLRGAKSYDRIAGYFFIDPSMWQTCPPPKRAWQEASCP